jgi:hypothetical protein
MHVRKRAMAMALTVALILAIGASAATASRTLEIEGNTTTWTLNQRAIEFLFATAGGIRCDLTLTKTLVRRVPKTAEAAFGRVTDVRVNGCVGTAGLGEIEVVVLGIEAGNTGLWKLFYQSFLGTLPRISGVRIRLIKAQIRFRFRAGLFDFNCLYENPEAQRVEMLERVEARGAVGNLTFLREARIVSQKIIAGETGNCPEALELLAEEMVPQQRVRLLLI